MSWTSVRGWPACVLALGAALAALGGVHGIRPASAETLRLGSTVIEVGGSVKPRRLPAKRRAPIELGIRGEIRRLDGSAPPGFERITIDFDRHGSIDTRGLPTCERELIENASTAGARSACSRALIGTGGVTFVVAFPGQAPTAASGQLLAFNGEPEGGRPTVLLHAYPGEPLTTAILSEAVISRASGRRFGHRLTIEIPPIAGGAGALTSFQIAVRRRWRHGSKRRSYVRARCLIGYFLAHGDLLLTDGTRVTGTLTRGCRRTE